MAARAAPASAPLVAGWLGKKRDHLPINAWRSRFFILDVDAARLYYYDDAPAGTLLLHHPASPAAPAPRGVFQLGPDVGVTVSDAGRSGGGGGGGRRGVPVPGSPTLVLAAAPGSAFFPFELAVPSAGARGPLGAAAAAAPSSMGDSLHSEAGAGAGGGRAVVVRLAATLSAEERGEWLEALRRACGARVAAPPASPAVVPVVLQPAAPAAARAASSSSPRPPLPVVRPVLSSYGAPKLAAPSPLGPRGLTAAGWDERVVGSSRAQPVASASPPDEQLQAASPRAPHSPQLAPLGTTAADPAAATRGVPLARAAAPLWQPPQLPPPPYASLLDAKVAELKALAASDDGWRSIGTVEGTAGYATTDGTPGCKGVGFLPFPRKALTFVLGDDAFKARTDPQFHSGRVLHRFDEHTIVLYWRFYGKLGVAGRDFVNLSHWRLERDGTLVHVAWSIPWEGAPTPEGVVRAHAHIGGWIARPRPPATGGGVSAGSVGGSDPHRVRQDEPGCDTVFLMRSDFAGTIPTFITRQVAAQQAGLVGVTARIMAADFGSGGVYGPVRLAELRSLDARNFATVGGDGAVGGAAGATAPLASQRAAAASTGRVAQPIAFAAPTDVALGGGLGAAASGGLRRRAGKEAGKEAAGGAATVPAAVAGAPAASSAATPRAYAATLLSPAALRRIGGLLATLLVLLAAALLEAHGRRWLAAARGSVQGP